MDRRFFLSLTLAAMAAPAIRLSAQPKATQTQWRVRTSEGFDAIAFLGALSGGELYLGYYRSEAAAFGAKLPSAIRADLAALRNEADQKGFGLLWPNLSTIYSGTDIATLDAVIEASSDPETRLRPAFQASQYWKESDWAWLTAAAPRLRTIFSAMRDAGFSRYRQGLVGDGLDAKAAELERALSGYDVVKWQKKLTGRSFDPAIDIILLHFSKPHGVRVQGQRFLQATDYGLNTTLRIAAHEMLHPPIVMDGPAAKAALALLGKDALITRVVRDHDPKWGYTTLDGYLNEDLVQALDQLISEALGFGRNPADRWRTSDDGMHVLAAGFYGFLRQDKWVETGGSIEVWLDKAVRTGRLAPASLHSMAARVLERPVDNLWPLA